MLIKSEQLQDELQNFDITSLKGVISHKDPQDRQMVDYIKSLGICVNQDTARYTTVSETSVKHQDFDM